MPRILTPDTLALTVLLGFLTALGPLSTDLYLPSLPAIARHFGSSAGDVQLTLSAYLIGFASGLPIYGPLSDRKGRKNVMMFGLVLFGLANAAAAVAPDLNSLILARFIQGLGAAGPLVIARSIVRDLFDGRRAAQELARMGTIMGVVPALSPILGAGLELAFGWRSNFIASFLLVGALAFVAIRKLPETLHTPMQEPFSIMAILRGFGRLLRDKRFLPYAMMAAATYSGLFAFLSGSSFLFQLHFSLSELQFALAFVMMVTGFLIGSAVSQRLAMRYDGGRLLRVGGTLQALGGFVMLACVLIWPSSPLSVVLPMMLYSSGVGFTLPQSMAGAMMPFPEQAGSVSSLVSIVQMSVAAVIGSAIGAKIHLGPTVLAATIAICGLAALAILPLLPKAPKRA